MPIYDYECKGCGHEFQKEQRITENPAKKCPACGARKAKRLVSRTNFVLKGSGWHNDLYSSKSAKKDSGAETGAESSSDSGSESKGDAKTESKGEGKTESEGKDKKASKKSGGGGSSKKKGQAAA